MKQLAAVLLILVVPATLNAQMKDVPMKDHKGMDMKMENKASGTTHKATGQVTKVDQAKGTVTIAHGPVASINWPSMTMAFKVKDKALLEKVKQGDKVEFSFTSSGRDHVITDMKP